jgi:hypothetical protein
VFLSRRRQVAAVRKRLPAACSGWLPRARPPRACSPKEASPQAEELLRTDALLSHVAARAQGATPRAPAATAPASLASGGSGGAASRRSLVGGGEGLEGLPPSAAVQFDELGFEQRIGEGSYGRVGRATQLAMLGSPTAGRQLGAHLRCS